tara:strand:+ start:80 stop:301 length:222 start_codon:yes stop_codon:yes gene_type:complete
MKEFIIYYSNGCSLEFRGRSLLSAKRRATQGYTYQMELDGVSVVIYENGEAICAKAFCRFTNKSGDIGKWRSV